MSGDREDHDAALRDEGRRRAVELLRECAVPAGFLATPTDTDNYRRVWGRDSCILSVAAAAHGDDDLLEAAVRTFDTLLEHQGPHGEIPSNVDPETGRVSYGGTTGRVDADLWFVIACGAYWHRTGDDGFLERRLPALERIRHLLGAWEFNTRGLLYVPLTGDWADEYLHHGYVLYDNLLYLQAHRCFAAFHHGLHGVPDRDLEDRSHHHCQVLRANYWFSEGVEEPPEHVYHPVLYSKGREVAGRCADRHWAPFFAPTGYGYRFDAFANVLVSLLDVANDDQRASVDAFIDEITPEDLELLPAFHPVIRKVDEDWEDLQMSFSYSFKNEPYEYHNGGLWPLITGFYVADLARRGHRDRALRFVSALHRANRLEMDGEAWSFPEFVHGRELDARGVRCQGWSAAAAVIAECALDGEPILGVGPRSS